MLKDASGMIQVEWQPAGNAGDELVMSMRFADRDALRRFAARLGAPPVLRVTSADGTAVVTTASAVLRWGADEPVPPADGCWTVTPPDRGDGPVAIDMLEAFLAWMKSRGLIDEAKSRRISRAVQMELGGAAGGTPG